MVPPITWRNETMEPLRDKIADIIDRETNARLMQDEIDILNGREVAQSIIAALPDMEAQAAEIARLRDALEWIKENDETGPIQYVEYPEGSGKFRADFNAQGPFGVRARIALEAKP